MKELIIHIGMPKTGTTSIQKSLHKSLNSRTHCYFDLKVSNHSTAIVSLFSNNTPVSHRKNAFSKNNIDSYNSNILNLIKFNIETCNKPIMIISGEDIFGMPKIGLEKLRDFFQTFFKKITIVGYIRTPKSYMESLFQQRVKGGLNEFNIDKLYPDYQKKIERFDSIFGRENVKLWKFDSKKFLDNNVVLDFCSRLEIPMTAEQTFRVNETLSTEAISLLYIYMKYGPARGKDLIKERGHIEKILKNIGNTKLRFSPSLLKYIIERKQDDTLWMEERLAEPLTEKIEYSTNDIDKEEKLEMIAFEAVKELEPLVDTKYIPNGTDIKTIDGIAIMMHALRLMIKDKMNSQQKKITKQDLNSLNITNVCSPAVGANKKLEKYLDEDTAKLIEEIHHDDVKLYGYDKKIFTAQSISDNDKKEVDNLVSIVIPCYNQAQYLEECVQSAVAQTYLNIEIIIVNDGSPDNTSETASALQKKYPHIIRVLTQENQGPSEARNNGIKVARGNYIFPLDADDKLDSNMLSHCMHQMLKNNADIIYVDIQCFGIADSFAKKKPFSENHLLYENLPSGSSLYSKKIWEVTGGYKQNMTEGYEDWEFWINAYKHNFTFFYLPETLLHYRVKDISRDTIAVEKDAYLKAKIVMNHPELYLTVRVEEAMSIIREAEELSDLYFYHDKNIPDNEDAWMVEIGNHLNSHPLEEKQILDIFDKRIGLYSLDILDENISTEAICKEMDVDFLLFYASIRYEIPLLRTSHYAWSRKNGIGKAEGNLFPYVYKVKREDPQLQHTASECLLQYQNPHQAKLKYLKEKEVMKKKRHLVSIVIPCYNQAPYLRETVESVIAQTYSNIEIVIVNDGSTDESEKVAKKLSSDHPDKNIQLLTQVNSGVSAARNFGIKVASGDFLFLLDADDILEKASISKCMHTMIEHDADIVYGDYQCFGERNNLQKTRAKVDLYFIQHTNITGATALYKRVVWEKAGGYKVNMGEGYEDWEFWVNVAKNSFRFHHIPEILFHYRVKKESRDVDATKKHTYLCSKVIMNNRELYTDEQQNQAVDSIRTFENSPTMYFYFNKSIFSKEKEIVSLIGKYIQDHDLYAKIQAHKTCIIPSLADFGSIALSQLNKIHNKNLLSTMNVDHHIFYEKLKYDTQGTDHSHTAISQFAWDKNEGCVPAEGTLFPLFVYKNLTPKIAAYKSSQRYERERYQILEKRLKEKENQIQNLESRLKNIPVNIISNEKPIQETLEKKIHLEEKRGKLVTIITRTKDRSLFIPRVFKTVIQQSYRPIEWVIVNDNGENIDTLISTLKVQYKEQLEGIEIYVINKEESTGMEAASNTGLTHAHGHYIKLLDDDDTIDVSCIAKQVYYMENEKLPNERGVVCYAQKTFEKIIENKIHFLNHEIWNLTPKYLTIAHLAKSNQFTVHSFLYERDVHNHIGIYNESLPVRGDWEFNLRFIMKFDIGVLPEVLVNYHFRTNQEGVHANSISTDHLRYDAVIRNEFIRNDKHHPTVAAVISNHVGITGLDRKLNDLLNIIKTKDTIISNK